MDESLLFKHCQDLQIKLTHGDSKDIDTVDLKNEIIIFCNIVE